MLVKPYAMFAYLDREDIVLPPSNFIGELLPASMAW